MGKIKTPLFYIFLENIRKLKELHIIARIVVITSFIGIIIGVLVFEYNFFNDIFFYFEKEKYFYSALIYFVLQLFYLILSIFLLVSILFSAYFSLFKKRDIILLLYLSSPLKFIKNLKIGGIFLKYVFLITIFELPPLFALKNIGIEKLFVSFLMLIIFNLFIINFSLFLVNTLFPLFDFKNIKNFLIFCFFIIFVFGTIILKAIPKDYISFFEAEKLGKSFLDISKIYNSFKFFPTVFLVNYFVTDSIINRFLIILIFMFFVTYYFLNLSFKKLFLENLKDAQETYFIAKEKAKYKAKSVSFYKAKSKIFALYLKEFLTFIRNKNYLIRIIFFLFLNIIYIILILRITKGQKYNIQDFKNLPLFILNYFQILIVLYFGLPSLYKEKLRLWILKTLPVNSIKLIFSKFLYLFTILIFVNFVNIIFLGNLYFQNIDFVIFLLFEIAILNSIFSLFLSSTIKSDFRDLTIEEISTSFQGILMIIFSFSAFYLLLNIGLYYGFIFVIFIFLFLIFITNKIYASR